MHSQNPKGNESRPSIPRESKLIRTGDPVIHPEPAEWMAFLYGELDRERQKALATHLERCEPCSAQVEGWRSSMASLDQWPAPARREARRAWEPMLKWAAAAAILLMAGFAVG